MRESKPEALGAGTEEEVRVTGQAPLCAFYSDIPDAYWVYTPFSEPAPLCAKGCNNHIYLMGLF